MKHRSRLCSQSSFGLLMMDQQKAWLLLNGPDSVTLELTQGGSAVPAKLTFSKMRLGSKSVAFIAKGMWPHEEKQTTTDDQTLHCVLQQLNDDHHKWVMSAALPCADGSLQLLDSPMYESAEPFYLKDTVSLWRPCSDDSGRTTMQIFTSS